MSAELAPGLEHRLTRVPWLGTVPRHWRETRLKYVARIQAGATIGQDYGRRPLESRPYLAVANVHHGHLKLDNVKQVSVPAEVADACTLQVGDVLLTEGGDLDKLGRGCIWRGEIPGCLHQNHIFAVRPSLDQLLPGYLVLLMESFHGRTYFLVTGKQTTNLASTNRTTLGNLPLFLPNVEEQRLLLQCFGYYNRLINRYIRAKQRLIALLTEQQQAIIDRAVTRGVDAGARLAPSGVAWLGDVPAHWTVRKLKQVAHLNPSRSEMADECEMPERVVFLPMERVSTDGSVDCSELKPVTDTWEGYTYFRRGDVVIAKITPCFENGKGACLDHLATPFGFGTSELIVLRPSQQILPMYLYFVTRARSFRARGEECMTGAAGQKRVPADFVKNYPIALPPVGEQAHIVSHIQGAARRFDEAIDRVRREIALVREYRARLIADVVTGKLDVRQVAPEALAMVDGEAEAEEVEAAFADEATEDGGELDGMEDAEESEG